MTHGRSGYNNNGCRCDICSEAERAYNRSAVGFEHLGRTQGSHAAPDLHL